MGRAGHNLLKVPPCPCLWAIVVLLMVIRKTCHPHNYEYMPYSRLTPLIDVDILAIAIAEVKKVISLDIRVPELAGIKFTV